MWRLASFARDYFRWIVAFLLFAVWGIVRYTDVSEIRRNVRAVRAHEAVLEQEIKQLRDRAERDEDKLAAFREEQARNSAHIEDLQRRSR